LLIRIAVAKPASWNDLDELHRSLCLIHRSIADAEPRFAALAATLVRGKVARHERRVEDLMRSREVGLAQASMSRLTFAPKNMRVG
jgi:hypothetical protein